MTKSSDGNGRQSSGFLGWLRSLFGGEETKSPPTETEPQEPLESEESREPKETKETKEPKETKASKASKEPKEPKETKDPKAPKESQNGVTLAPPDSRFLCEFAKELGITEGECLELLTRPLADNRQDHTPTEIRDGHFVSLNLFLKLKILPRIPGLENLAHLRRLNCSSHSLELLDLHGLRELETLDCSSHSVKVFRIDITGCDRLVDVEYTPTVVWAKPHWATLVCTELQKRILFPTARKGFEIVPSSPAEMHARVARYNWDWGLGPLKWIAKHPQCDRGTALMIYWQGSPRWYAQYGAAKDAPSYEKQQLQMLRAIERRFLEDGYESNDFPFDPQNDTSGGGTMDWTAEDDPEGEVKHPVPEEMCRPS